MQQDERRRTARLLGAKDLHGEADRIGAGTITRLRHDQPAAFTPDLARLFAIHQAIATLEPWKPGLGRRLRRDGHGQ